MNDTDYSSEFDYNKGLIQNENNNNVYDNVFGDNSKLNSNNNYNNNPNEYNNNPNEYINNPNEYNNNFNNNNEPFTSNNNSQPNPSNNSDIKPNDDLSNEIEDDKFCYCCYSRDFLREIPKKIRILIFILCFYQILLNILIMSYNKDADIIFLLINSVQFFYVIFCLVTITNIKCFRYFGTIFNVIISIICGLLIIVEFIFYFKENEKKGKQPKHYITHFILFRGIILCILIFIMFAIYCRTFCKRLRRML